MPTNLNDSQIKTAQQIAQYGQDHGFAKEQIDTALKTAYIRIKSWSTPIKRDQRKYRHRLIRL